MKVNIQSSLHPYTIHIENHLLNHINEYLEPHRHYVIITDQGVPTLYVNQIVEQVDKVYVKTIEQGESAKSMESYIHIMNFLTRNNITKADCLIALGGGVVGDITGFVASTYLRGIDYIQIPTTLLAQVDASIGGKTSINFAGAKNVIGQIFPPIKVLIDPQTLNTLSNRHFNNGIAEIIKYALIASKPLYDMLKEPHIIKRIDEIIYQSILIKKTYVENDEFDQHQRHILNFGHTLGHAYESFYQYRKYLHGEAVALGMLPMIKNETLKDDVINLLQKFELPYKDEIKSTDMAHWILKDKKRLTDTIDIILLDQIEQARIQNVPIQEIHDFFNNEV